MPHPRRFTDDQALEAYARLGSHKKAAAELGVCAQSVHERLQKLGASRPVNMLSEADASLLRDYYTQTPDDAFDLGVISRRLGRARPLVCRYARLMGLTRQTRACSEKTVASMKAARAGRQSHGRILRVSYGFAL